VVAQLTVHRAGESTAAIRAARAVWWGGERRLATRAVWGAAAPEYNGSAPGLARGRGGAGSRRLAESSCRFRAGPRSRKVVVPWPRFPGPASCSCPENRRAQAAARVDGWTGRATTGAGAVRQHAPCQGARPADVRLDKSAWITIGQRATTGRAPLRRGRAGRSTDRTAGWVSPVAVPAKTQSGSTGKLGHGQPAGEAIGQGSRPAFLRSSDLDAGLTIQPRSGAHGSAVLRQGGPGTRWAPAGGIGPAHT